MNVSVLHFKPECWMLVSFLLCSFVSAVAIYESIEWFPHELPLHPKKPKT